MTNFENHPLFPGRGLPLFIAPGVVKDAQQLEQFMDLDDPEMGFVVNSGGWTFPDWSGNATSQHPIDFIYYDDRSMAGNSRGLPSSCIEGIKLLSEPIKRLSNKGIKTIIQVTNLPHETPIDVIPQMVEVAADQKPAGIEVNLSCPNGKDKDGNLHPPTCNNIDASEEIMSTSRDRVGHEVTLGAKDSPHASSLESGVDVLAIADLARALGQYIDFYTGINTIGGQPFPELTCAGGKGGMSGPVVAEIAREWLRIARAALDPSIPILSCGGVDSNNAAYEIPLRLKMGAMLVGGAQEFYRATRPLNVMTRWAQAYAESVND